MARDYRKFKTPFYEIEIGDPSWNRTIKLPHHILRLVEKVEIVENMMVDHNQTPSIMHITFVEGSREPASPDYKLGTSGLYQIPIEGNKVDMDISGSLTNRPGVITDLRFSGAHGITFLTEYEKKTGKLDNRIQKNVEGKNTTRKYKSEPSAPEFLFQQRNKVKVTWGYLESPELKRSVMLSIVAIQTEFPETGMPKTTITCGSTFDILNQVAPKDSIPVGIVEKVDTSGNKTIIFKDLDTDVVLRDICKKSGMACIISKNLPNSKSDKDKQKIMVAGESFSEFLVKLARKSGAYHEIKPNPETGIDTIFFIKKEDFEKRTILKDRELLHWKGPGSILKNVSIGADFSGLMGNTQKGVDSNGDPQSHQTMVPVQMLTKYPSSETGKNPGLIDADPSNSGNPNPAAKGIQEHIYNGNSSAVVEVSPKEAKENYIDTANTRAGTNSRLVQLTFTTIGYPKLMPGVMEVTGIGVRYSGKYKIISVTHTIDNNGYISTCQGSSEFLNSGGVKIPDAPEGKEVDDSVKVQLLKDRKEEDKDTQIEYKKFHEGK